MNKILILMAGFLVVPMTYAGVMERLLNDPNTGLVVAVLDDDAPENKEKVSVKTSVNKQREQSKGELASGQGEMHVSRTMDAKGPRPPQKKEGREVEYVETETLGQVASSSVVRANVSQPTVKKAPVQNALRGGVYDYLLVVRPNARVKVNERDGLVYFQMRTGSLKENIVALLEPTNALPPVMSDISDNHEVAADMWLSGDSVLEILDSMLVSYFKPFPIYAEPRGNRIVEVKYDRKRIFGSN
ncbi:hypothetical protein AB9X29_003761 [Vibrio vulnificus]